MTNKQIRLNGKLGKENKNKFEYEIRETEKSIMIDIEERYSIGIDAPNWLPEHGLNPDNISDTRHKIVYLRKIYKDIAGHSIHEKYQYRIENSILDDVIESFRKHSMKKQKEILENEIKEVI